MEETLPETPKPVPQRRRMELEAQWPLRLAGQLLILFFIAALCIAITVLRTDLVQRRLAVLAEELLEKTNRLGLSVDEIAVSGNKRTSQEEILAAIAVENESNILRLDLAEVRERLESLPWVRKASVSRGFLPNRLDVAITEKEVAALWEHGKKDLPVDTDGQVVEAGFKPDLPLLKINGDGAPQSLGRLLEIVRSDPAVFARVKSASYVSRRRWNVFLDDPAEGITVKLPEDDPEAAWKKLLKLDKTRAILNRKLRVIDLRLSDRVIVEFARQSPAKPADPIKESNI